MLKYKGTGSSEECREKGFPKPETLFSCKSAFKKGKKKGGKKDTENVLYGKQTFLPRMPLIIFQKYPPMH